MPNGAHDGGEDQTERRTNDEIAADLVDGILTPANRLDDLDCARNGLVGNNGYSIDQQGCAIFAGGVEAMGFAVANGGQGDGIVIDRHWPQIVAAFEDHAIEVNDLHAQRVAKEVEVGKLYAVCGIIAND